MKIAVLSGKGGTGKTFVSVNLAVTAKKSMYIDCDVEEPNGHVFLRPQNISEEMISVKKPVFDYEKCIGCRKCVDFCRYGALVFVKNKPKLFPDICHSCGGCELICPVKAVSEKDERIGMIQRGEYKKVSVKTGILDPGVPSGVPLIHACVREEDQDQIMVIDCPPGSACTVIESIEDADFCVIATEPTIFGLHNFKMVQELVMILGKPYGVVINKLESFKNPMDQYCIEKHLPLLAHIPFKEELFQSNAEGLIACEIDDEIAGIFEKMFARIKNEVTT